MKRLMSLAVMAALVCAGTSLAGPEHKCGSKDKSGCSKYQQVAGKSGCDKACDKNCDPAVCAVLASLPQMKYQAGDLETPCLKTASEKVGCESKVKYVVDGKAYDCKNQASAELASLLEKQLEQMMTVQYSVNGECVGCPTAAKQVAAKHNAPVKYRLAGVDFDTQDKADAAAKAAHEAVANLAKDQGVSKCPVTGKTVAGTADSGCSKAKAVAGESKRGCCSKDKGSCCSKAATVAGDSKGKSCAKSGCSKATTVAGDSKSGCTKAQTVAGDSKAGCCPKGACPNEDAEKHLVQVQEMLRLAVETATRTKAS